MLIGQNPELLKQIAEAKQWLDPPNGILNGIWKFNVKQLRVGGYSCYGNHEIAISSFESIEYWYDIAVHEAAHAIMDEMLHPLDQHKLHITIHGPEFWMILEAISSGRLYRRRKKIYVDNRYQAALDAFPSVEYVRLQRQWFRKELLRKYPGQLLSKQRCEFVWLAS